MKILVVGSRGMVGRSLMTHFKKLDFDTTGTSRQEMDLLNRRKTFDAISRIRPDILIDAAAVVGGVQANNEFPVDYLAKNIRMQINLMEAAHEFGVQRLIFLGSSCIYPRICPQPIKEEYLMTAPLETTNSAYAIAKISGIELVNSYRKQFGRDWISLMPSNLYGKYDNFNLENSHVLPALIRKFIEAKEKKVNKVILWGDGSAMREFLHVDDLANAIHVAIDSHHEAGHINIGSGSEISIRNLALLVSEVVDFKGSIEWDSSKPNGTPRKILDSRKFREYGWSPKIKLREGIEEVSKWYLNSLTKKLEIRL